MNINNNYLIPTPVYDIPNEVIDDGSTTQQQQLQSTAAAGEDGEEVQEATATQEVMLYDGNNNPLSS